VWKSSSSRTAARRGRRLPAALTLVLLLVGSLVAWNAKGKERRPQAPAHPVRSAEATGFLEGRVVGISDGDTLTLLDASEQSIKVRLLGIDAPEKAQPFGKVAKQVLSDKIFHQTVRVQVKSRDRYGRTLGKVLRDGVDINLAMLQEGLVWHYKHYADDQFPGDAQRYAQAEAEARKAKLGLWGYDRPVEPWSWRQDQKRSRK